jgi:hypothetical protein
MSDIETPEGGRRGIDRRTLIKRAAATGAVAWTAPLIIDSLASPAAALTCTGNCFLVQFGPAGAGAPNCNTTSQTVATGAGLAPCPSLGSSNCSSITSVAAGFTPANACLSSAACQAGTATVTFTLDATSTGCFSITQGTCAPPRRILAAQAKSATAPGVPTCNTGTIGATGTTVSFTKAANTSWVWFQILIGCGCS